MGNEHDAVILLTDYQTAKKSPPLRISIIDYAYLQGSEIADKNLCDLVRKYRKWLLSENETWAKKVFRFAAYVNQSDWRARQILNFIENLDDENKISQLINNAEEDYQKQNKKRSKDDRAEISTHDLEKIRAIGTVKPFQLGIITAADDWVAETQKDIGRLPNENEWERLKNSPLNGKIGMSFALQWRYNFGLLFRKK